MTHKILAAALAAITLAVGPAPALAQTCAPAHPCGDINESDDITVADALAVLRRSIGLTADLTCSCSGGDECPTGGVTETYQTQCWDPLDAAAPINVINCAGTGQDGEFRPGLAPSFVDNGDGTITDTRTTLVWEKLSDDNSVHDYDNVTRRWEGAFQKADLLNQDAFAGYTDWRVPTIRELASLVDYAAYDPAVPPIFDTGCTPGCTVSTCSCTNTGDYWSSTTYEQTPTRAWSLDAQTGITGNNIVKTTYIFVRLVRGGY